jgi:rubrerythrin
MMDLRGSQTERNLLTAFAGESQARNRYTYAAERAREEGYEQIGAIFEETANQEKEHAKRLFKFLQGGEAQVQAGFPAGVIGSTLENLRAAAAGEHYENTQMYPEFAQVAKEEGFKEIAGVFTMIAVAEKRHEDRYVALARNITDSLVFKRTAPTRWVCRNCGLVHEGTDAPKVCPACGKPQAFFELEAVNY